MTNLWEPVCGVYSSNGSFLPCIGWLVDLGNSSFFTTVFGALAGAFAGAWAAQRIATRSKLREELIKEIRSTNSALLLGQVIFNVAVTTKIEWSRTLQENFDEELEIFKKHGDDFVKHLSRPLNLETIKCAPMPIDQLSHLVLTEISSSTAAMRAFVQLQISTHSYAHAHGQRNALIKRFQDGDFQKPLRFEDMYFGETYKKITNTEYKDSLRSINKFNDDTIFYCLKMCESLYDHAAELKKRYKEITNAKITIQKLIVSPDLDPDVIPKDELYAGFLAGHINLQSPVAPPWWRLGKRS
ncbi:hypothetical protein [Pseudomonas sp. PS01301]|uniref:hypothetical protein n=1 Tax=Pseudomonas sp. PS01301 TaxID=2991437 RepID=UPI00249C9000|nr:hypothetical protein [Pseudomonas sp. PS01301]